MYELALKIVEKEFEGITDRGGNPYIDHLKAVADGAGALAKRFGYDVEVMVTAGLLHDLVEDIPRWEVGNIRVLFGDDVAEIVDNVTKRPGEDIKDYYKRVGLRPESVLVKAADATHNSKIERIPNPTENDLNRVKKYAKIVDDLLESIKDVN